MARRPRAASGCVVATRLGVWPAIALQGYGETCACVAGFSEPGLAIAYEGMLDVVSEWRHVEGGLGGVPTL